MMLSSQLREEFVLAGLELWGMLILDDGYNGVICFSQLEASKIKTSKAKTYAGLHTEMIKKDSIKRKELNGAERKSIGFWCGGGFVYLHTQFCAFPAGEGLS
jgi:hypothetical protein